MKTKIILFVIVIMAFVIACQKVPITGRKQVSLIPESELIGMSLTSYRDFLSKNQTVPTTDANAIMVKRVGDKVSKAVELFMREKGLSSKLAGYKWEFN